MPIIPKTIIISRTDSIGDVVLTLPMCGVLKQYFPSCKILFLGNTYTLPVLKACKHIEKAMDWWDIKKRTSKEQIEFFNSLNADTFIHVFPNKQIANLISKTNIKYRIGTNRRIYHLFSCNRLVNLTRKNTDLHESQLNLKLLKPLGINIEPPLSDIPQWFGLQIETYNPKLKQYIVPDKFNLILHPKSKGSAREWGLDNFNKLINLLPCERYNILVSGTEEEGKLFRNVLFTEKKKHVTDISGKLSLEEFISLINLCNGLVAASTGPLHLAAALNKKAIGLFAPMRPIFPKRWRPLGRHAHVLVKNKICNDCRKSGACHCIMEIEPQQVVDILNNE
jgi:ADP-heptose:LPS heptosyltransferase